MSIKNDGHYFCRAGGNRPDGLNEPVTICCSNGDNNGARESCYYLLQRAPSYFL
ncbi:hypothetical protein AGQ19_002696 [Salmonella enterica subsp. enterica]|nr:hypothetical protein [Salmonella enterica subsp. enterica]